MSNDFEQAENGKQIFKEGHKKRGGRKKGVQNLVTRQVKDVVRKAFDELGGVKYLVQVGKEDPKTFLALFGKIIPHDLNVEHKGKVTITTVLEAFDEPDSSSKEEDNGD